MRKIATLCLFAFLSSISQSQNLQPLNKDSRALLLIQQVLATAGPAVGQTSGTITSGTIRLAGDPNTYPIRIYTLGNSQSRTEIDRSNGTSVRILNAGSASFQPPGGGVIHLNLLNTLAERIMHVPSSSLMAEYASPNVQIEYICPAQLSGLRVVQFSASWSAAAAADDQAIFLKRTKVLYSVDPLTYRILEVEFDRCAENDTNDITHYRSFYTSYQTLGGRTVPSSIVTFANDVFSSELHINSYSEDAQVSASSFVIPEVTN